MSGEIEQATVRNLAGLVGYDAAGLWGRQGVDALLAARGLQINLGAGRKVMASPPTITLTTTNALASARFISAVQLNSAGGASAINPIFDYRLAAAPIIVGTGFPNYNYVRFTSVDSGPTLGKNANFVNVPIRTDATRIVFFVKGAGTAIVVRIDGEYESVTSRTATADGSGYYFDIDFGAYAMREIELITSGNLQFGGIYVAADAVVLRSIPKGPRTAILWDSFGEGTGASSLLNCAVLQFIDGLGWNNVYISAVGSTGLIATSGDKLNYQGRLAASVLPYSPQIVIPITSINDSFQTPAAMTSAMGTLISTVRASVPSASFILTSMMANRGGTLAPNYYDVTDALAALAASGGHGFINLLEQPLPKAYVPQTTALLASAADGATSIQTAIPLAIGTTYKFADKTRALIKGTSYSGGIFTSTIDYIYGAKSSGAVLTECGGSMWSGSGKVGATTGFGSCDRIVGSDGTHPTGAGHSAISIGLVDGMRQIAA